MSAAAILLQISEWLGVGSVTWIAGLSKRFQRRPIKFLYQRREYIVTFSMFALALAIGLIARSLFRPAAPFSFGGLPEELFVRLLLAVILLAPFLIALLYRRQPARTIGWSSTWRPSLQLGIGFLALVIFLHGKIFALINHMNAAAGLVILALVAAALLEESVFRGFIFIRLTSGLGDAPGLAVSALMGVVWQALFFINFQAPAELVAFSLGVCLVRNLLCGWIMQKSGHVLAPALYSAVSALVAYLP